MNIDYGSLQARAQVTCLFSFFCTLHVFTLYLILNSRKKLEFAFRSKEKEKAENNITVSTNTGNSGTQCTEMLRMVHPYW